MLWRVRYTHTSRGYAGIGRKDIQTSLYWIFRLGLRSILAMFWASVARCWMNISCVRVTVLGMVLVGTGKGGLAVARVITKAALLEQTVMSGSTATIFLTRVTG